MSLALSATQPTPTCTDTALVSAVRQGSDRAFEELYSRYRVRISSYISGMVGDHARAEDIAQDVFISALRRLRQTDRSIVFKPWLYEIAKNACIDEFRRSRRAREVPLGQDDDDSHHDDWQFASGQTPDVAIESKQSLQDLRGAFHGLSESHHRLIVMREFEGLSYNEIGERLGMTRPVVESTLFRARRRLTEEYHELVSGRRCEHVQSLLETVEPKMLLKLGVRERRQLARHLAHCQPCRRHARLAGVDESLFQAPGIRAKIAALLPLPWLRVRRGGSEEQATSGANAHSSVLLQPLQRIAQYADSPGAASGMGRAAATIAALAVAGLGGGVVSAVASHPRQTMPVRSAQPTAPGRSAPAAPATTRKQPAAAVHRGPNGKAWIRLGQGATGSATATASPPAAISSTGAGGSGGSGTGSKHLGRGSSLTGPVSGAQVPKRTTVLGVTVPGTGTVQLPSLPRLHKPSLPKLGKPALPSVPTGAGSKGAGVQAPQLPKVSLPGVSSPLPKVSLPDPTKSLHG